MVCDDRIVKLTFYVFLWSHPGTDEALIAYEAICPIRAGRRLPQTVLEPSRGPKSFQSNSSEPLGDSVNRKRCHVSEQP